MSRLVPEWLLAAAASQPDEVAVIDSSTRWTNRQLEAVSGHLATTLGHAGGADGIAIATIIRDGAPAISLIHAARRLGATLVPLNRRASAHELRSQLGTSDSRLLIHDLEHAELAWTAVADASHVRTLAIEDLEALPADQTRGGPALRDEVDLDAAATILFTSGTSSRPKGAVLSHGNHLASADAWRALLQPRPTDRWLACLPLFHVAGLAMVVRASRWGVPIEVQPHFVVADVDAALERGASHLSLVVPLLLRLLDYLEERRDDPPVPSTLRAVLLGGGPIQASLIARSRRAGLPVISTYGMTETASGVAAGTPSPPGGADSDGLRPLQGVELRIERETDEADPRPVGEILVRAPMVFSGYVGPDGGEHSSPGEQWLHTGDLGWLDDEGLLHIAGRRDDLLISGGENISPAEVESVLLTHPAVADAVVVGRPDADWGVVPVAVIVVRPGEEIEDAALAAYCRERLARFKVPVEFRRRASLPRNAAGKILRRDLRDALLEEAG